MKFTRLILIFIFLFTCSAEASITECGTGMIFGSDHAFNFTAPNGWVLDNQSGVQQGIHMAFYPTGQTWKNSPVIAYGMSVAKDSETQSIEDQARRTVEDFRSNGSKNYTAEVKEEIQLPDGKTAKIYYFHGDQWENYEAAGYIEEKESINFLVFNSRNKLDFEKNLPAFKSILISYKNVFKPKSREIDETTFNKLIREAEAFEITKEGAVYNAKFFQEFGNSLADIMKSCTSYTTKGQNAQFDLLLRIAPDGGVSELFMRPSNALTTCVSGLVQESHHPQHKFESVLLYLNISVKE